jgi:hypothetical protein
MSNMKNPIYLAFLICITATISCDSTKDATTSLGDNQLTAKEKANGWELLFDGKTLAGWRNYGKQSIGKNWQIQDNSITLVVGEKGANGWQAADGGDIITDQEFENYELQLQWKISACGNSGIIFNVMEDSKYEYVWKTGPEMQILDNTCHPDGKITKHRAGDLYDLIKCSKETVKPAGEWNQVSLSINKGHLKTVLNGTTMVETDLWNDTWKALVAGSKFKEMPAFGTVKKGHLALQDHGNQVWFKNVKIRKL